MDRVKRTVESDRLRGALLTSISHDLKTPLASVLGAACTLRDLGAGLNDAQKHDLLATVIDEIRAAQPVHRQSARHDQARIRRHRAATPRGTMSARSSAARCGAPARSSCITRCRWSSAPICRCWSSTPCCSNRCCSTCSDNAAKYAPAGTTISIRERGIRDTSRCRSWTRATAFRRRSWKACSTSSIAHRRAITSAPAPVLASRSPAVLSRRCTARSRPPTAADRSGAMMTIRLPIPADIRRAGYRRMNARPDQGPGHRRRAADPQAAADGAEHAGL